MNAKEPPPEGGDEDDDLNIVAAVVFVVAFAVGSLADAIRRWFRRE